MSLRTERRYTRKTHTAFIYKWAPQPFEKNAVMNDNTSPYYCTATAGSQGQDWVVTYTYDITVVNGVQGHLAYVACDYVE